MKRFLVLASTAIALGTPLAAQSFDPITVSCFRGPWQEVIWDRPNAQFIENLVSFGYDYRDAEAIATRICRDDELVGDPEAIEAEMKRILREYPTQR